ncbi:hypothetical protein B0H14DRAFT_3427801 [Mycena olivaceomarginata]|nr:hypothetical protein B0H14DRAFT_3427801 [Mycena olivaceomarginata]
MHAFKFVSLPAAAVLMLLALVQGGVAQGVAEVVEPVPLGGLCGSIAGTKPCVSPGVCCYIHPDEGYCQLKCPTTSS